MPVRYFDTSALVKHYHGELGSDRVDAIFADLQNQLFVSRFAIAELFSAFARKVRSGVLAIGQFDLLVVRTRTEVATGVLSVVAVVDNDYSEAERLLQVYSCGHALRAGDALQLAVASRMRGIVGDFICSDHDLGEVARLEGFSVTNPEQP